MTDWTPAFAGVTIQLGLLLALRVLDKVEINMSYEAALHVLVSQWAKRDHDALTSFRRPPEPSCGKAGQQDQSLDTDWSLS
jgi:hypothetical protein